VPPVIAGAGGELAAEVPAIPEADTVVLFVAGLAGLVGFAAWRRRQGQPR
jgi:MYXO-CTERM domain-containing protein